MYNELIREVKDMVKETVHIIQKKDRLHISQKGEKDFVTEVDLAISEKLCRELPKLLKESVVISEEGYQGRPEEKYCWIIDPIDGTNNLIYDLPAYAVSVGLLEERKPVLGVVYNAKTEEMFWAVKDKGAYCDDRRIQVCQDSSVEKTLVLAETNPYCDRKENPFHQVMDNIFCDCIDYRITGSAALDCCYVACGRGGAFVAQNLKPWDYAAGKIILEEAGGCLTQWSGEELEYYGNSSILASNGLLHEELLERLKKFL